MLGAGTLKDLALALFIGLASGAYSSIFIATPLLCDMKEREPAFRQLARRVAARQGSLATQPMLATAGGPSVPLRETQPAREVPAATTRHEEQVAEVPDEPPRAAPTRPPTQPRRDARRRKGGRGGRSSRKRRR